MGAVVTRPRPVDLRDGVVQVSMVPDRLNRHDLSEQERERPPACLPAGRSSAI